MARFRAVPRDPGGNPVSLLTPHRSGHERPPVASRACGRPRGVWREKGPLPSGRYNSSWREEVGRNGNEREFAPIWAGVLRVSRLPSVSMAAGPQVERPSRLRARFCGSRQRLRHSQNFFIASATAVPLVHVNSGIGQDASDG